MNRPDIEKAIEKANRREQPNRLVVSRRDLEAYHSLIYPRPTRRDALGVFLFVLAVGIALIFCAFWFSPARAAELRPFILDEFDTVDTTASASVSSPELWRTIHEDNGPQIIYREAFDEPGENVLAIAGFWSNDTPGSDMVGLASNYLGSSYGSPVRTLTNAVMTTEMRILLPAYSYFDTLSPSFEKLRAVNHFCMASPDNNSTVYMGRWNDDPGVGWRTRSDGSTVVYKPNPVTAMANATDWSKWMTYKVVDVGGLTTGWVELDGTWYEVGDTLNTITNRQLEPKAFYFGDQEISVEWKYVRLDEIVPDAARPGGEFQIQGASLGAMP